ncbi:hypothetical protein ACN47E_001305, partial [Coniothyrium glycines]
MQARRSSLSSLPPPSSPPVLALQPGDSCNQSAGEPVSP